jgi:hypothetical protein
MRDRVARAAEAAGRSIDVITCALNVEVRIGGGPGADPDAVAGEPEAVAERLIELAGQGFTAFNLKPVGPGRDEQIERLAREVVPAVRAAT